MIHTKKSKEMLNNLSHTIEKIDSAISELSEIKISNAKNIIKKIIQLENNDYQNLLFDETDNTTSSKEKMIGALPDLLMDQDLFKKNEDLASFAKHVLQLDVKFGKKARVEIIGIIICELATSDKDKLDTAYFFIEKISKNENVKQKIKNDRKDSNEFSWSDAIIKIGGLDK